MEIKATLTFLAKTCATTSEVTLRSLPGHASCCRHTSQGGNHTLDSPISLKFD